MNFRFNKSLYGVSGIALAVFFMALNLVACGEVSDAVSDAESLEVSSASQDDVESSSSEKAASEESSSDEATSSSSDGESSEESSSSEEPITELVDERDGQKYRVVTIGDQVWMAENLNYAYTQASADLDSTSFCAEAKPENCKTYGRLYQWSAVMDSAGLFSEGCLGCGYKKVGKMKSGNIRGVCPEKWHVPSKNEWKTLFEYVDGLDSAAYWLKSDSSEWINGILSDDKYEFSVKPAGEAYNFSFNVGDGEEIKTDSPDGVVYGAVGYYSMFWTSSKTDSKDDAWAWQFSNDFDEVRSRQPSRYQALSVRCVKD